MAQSEEIMDFINVQTGFTDETYKVVGVVHLAITIGDSREIETRLGETQGRSVETLTIP